MIYTTQLCPVKREEPQRIPFDIEKYKSGNYDVVCFDETSKPEIIKLNAKHPDYPIIGVIYYREENETPVSWNKIGKFYRHVNMQPNPCDLLLIPKQSEDLSKRDFWVNEYPTSFGNTHKSKERADELCIRGRIRCVHYKFVWLDELESELAKLNNQSNL